MAGEPCLSRLSRGKALPRWRPSFSEPRTYHTAALSPASLLSVIRIRKLIFYIYFFRLSILAFRPFFGFKIQGGNKGTRDSAAVARMQLWAI